LLVVYLQTVFITLVRTEFTYLEAE